MTKLSEQEIIKLYRCHLCGSEENHKIRFTRIIADLPKTLIDEATKKTRCCSKKYISICLKCENGIRIIQKKPQIEKVCPFCYNDNGIDDCAYICSASPMWEVQVHGSRGMKIKNIEKWKASGVDIKKLPNSEWFTESYIRTDFYCENCSYKEYGEEIPCKIVSDDISYLNLTDNKNEEY